MEELLFIDQIESNPNLQVLLVNGNFKMKGFLTEDFVLDCVSNWSSPFDIAQEGLQQRLQSAIATAATLGADVSQFKLKNLGTSILQWESSERPSFEIEFWRVKVDDKKDTLEDVKKLMEYIYPKQESTLKLIPPGNYKYSLDPSRIPEGTFSLRIGEWFEVHGLVMTSLQVSHSKLVSTDGKPYRVRIRCQFTLYRIPDFNMAKSWYLR